MIIGDSVKTLTLAAPAKINYLLDVIGKRPDGYHDLRMVMQRIDLCDQITIRIVETSKITVTCGKKGVPDGEGNIAWKAAKAMLDISGANLGAEIDIVKNIPVAAGLGGGSSDAATVLTGMNELLGLALSDARLMEIGLKLGADVPFFIYKKTALAEGVGNLLSDFPALPKAFVLLVNPGIHVSTGWVYKNLQLTNGSSIAKIPNSFATVEDFCKILSNDLEAVTISAHPLIGQIKQMMKEHGAAGSLMSGSGATVFGLFKERHAAEEAGRRIVADKGWFHVVAETL